MNLQIAVDLEERKELKMAISVNLLFYQNIAILL